VWKNRLFIWDEESAGKLGAVTTPGVTVNAEVVCGGSLMLTGVVRGDVTLQGCVGEGVTGITGRGIFIASVG